MKQITILSGKGGVGKSSISASLAVVISENKRLVAVDCDVDAANLALVLGIKVDDFEKYEKISTNEKAVIDPDKCIGCKKCFDSCNFSAISWDGNSMRPSINEFGCEGCGVCTLVCPKGAISQKKIFNANIGYAKTRFGFYVVSGQLNMGESGSGKIVHEVRALGKDLAKDTAAELIINDAAAGIGCPVIASVVGSSYAVLVTEPSPSGFSDMKRAFEMVDHFKIKSGLVINKHDLNPEFCKEIEAFAKEKNISLLAKIPYDKSFLEALVNLTPVAVHNSKIRPIFESIAAKLLNELEFSD
ncbi:MAG: ATP-binding protein [Nanoarchaeota archaeon]|nr:ATP-binding protein [Nanoarchaeota archaeon]